MIGLIVAINPNGVIGVNGTIPWHYPLDLKRFKEITTGAAIIMGRKTWESIGSKPLPNRSNFVVSSDPKIMKPGMAVAASVKVAYEAAKHENRNVWFIGGKQIYEEALKLGVVEVIDITRVPDKAFGAATDVTYFRPDMWLNLFVRDYSNKHPDQRLELVRYHRIDTLDAQVILKGHHISASCGTEVCTLCGKEATHKVGEEISHDDPFPQRHNLTAYVCCDHFHAILGPATGCKLG